MTPREFDQKRQDKKDSLISGFLTYWELGRVPTREQFNSMMERYYADMKAINEAEGWYGG